MPQIIFTPDAISDLVRLREFLEAKNAMAAARAASVIKTSLQSLAKAPEAYRPVPDRPHERELIIGFGSSGYVARYRYKRGGDILILRIWHQLEQRS